MEIKITRKFDPLRMRYYINGENYVMHCFYYLDYMIEVTNKLKIINATELMRETAEETFYDILNNYLKYYPTASDNEKKSIIEHYFHEIGLGSLKIDLKNNTVYLKNSCIDKSWIIKYKTREKFINFITQGYICAAYSILYKKSIKGFTAEETEFHSNNELSSTLKIMQAKDNEDNDY